MAWAKGLIKGTDYEHNFDKSHAPEGWYREFLCRQYYPIGAERPLEMTRHEELALSILETYFDVCVEVFLRADVASLNHDYDPNVEGS
jgi:hypothetical protein